MWWNGSFCKVVEEHAGEAVPTFKRRIKAAWSFETPKSLNQSVPNFLNEAKKTKKNKIAALSGGQEDGQLSVSINT